ncbi:hypothetical protein Tco_0317344 [Tanacetum coccineum]
MIGSLMYLTASRPDIMFVVCACARFQVTPKTSHFNAVKRIFRYLKGQPKLGLWYPRDSPFDLEAFSDSDYARASLDRKSTTGGCQFLGKRLISWQCKKQTIVANSTTEAEYVAAANCFKTDKAKHIEYLVGTQRYLSLVVPLKKVGDEAVHKELGDRMERAATNGSSFEAEIGMIACQTATIFEDLHDAEVTLVNETQDWQDEDLMFDTGVLDGNEMFMDATTGEKDEQSTKIDDSTAGEAVTTAGVEDSAAPTIQVSTADIGDEGVTTAKIDELTLAQTLIEIKAAKPKVVITATTTTTTTRSNVSGVVVQEPSEFRTSSEAQPS